jgi:hypothetical protein
MDTMPARWIKADCADMVQTLNDAEHRDRLRRFRHLGVIVESVPNPTLRTDGKKPSQISD